MHCPSEVDFGEPEEDVLIYLPRNLSYAEESYLDRYSVSSAFVHNSKLEKQLPHIDADHRYLSARAEVCGERSQQLHHQQQQHHHHQQHHQQHQHHQHHQQQQHRQQGQYQYHSDRQHISDSDHLWPAPVMAASPTGNDSPCDMLKGGPEGCDLSLEPRTVPTTSSVTIPSPFLPPLTVNIDHAKSSDTQSDFDRYVVKTAESPDSDLISEEGIFVNMMDDLEVLGAVGGKCTLSEASDDTCVSGDSMYYSPLEVDQVGGEHRLGEFRLSLEEAVHQAASRLQPADVPMSVTSAQHSAACGEHTAQDTASQAQSIHTTQPQAPAEQTDVSSTPSDGTGSCSPARSDAKADSCGSNAAARDLRKLTGALEITINDRPFQRDGQLSSSYRDLMSPESPVYEDREFNFTRKELRKSASLKSSKTPPGTPRRKKVVRFADALGLDLESVRHVLNMDTPPKIPPSAMKDLQTGLSEDRKEMGTKFITETFRQPGADISFRERVLSEKVVLENALVVAGSITGVVRVANITFHKKVRVRFSINGWTTFHDIAASYMHNSGDGGTDRFSFTLVPPSDFGPGSKLEFAVSFSANGLEFWDNNHGTNYGFECYAKTVPTEAENAWMHFL